MFGNIEINENQVKDICNDYSVVEVDVFSIYSLFAKTIASVVTAVSSGKLNDESKAILGKDFIKLSKAKIIDTFGNKQKDAIKTSLTKINAIFFDGFLFFDELQKYILKTAIELNKPVFILSKQFEDGTGLFLLEESLKNIESEKEHINFASEPSVPISALDIMKAAYPIMGETVYTPEQINDGSIRFISPFLSREEEIRYIVKQISKRLKDSYTGEISNLQRELSEIAIVIGRAKEKYEERIDNLFYEIGVFTFKGVDYISSTEYASVDINTFDDIYFNRDEFLRSNIRFISGSSLTFNEKFLFFRRCFHKIEINKHYRPISSYPIGQFILLLYKSIRDGMDIESFKGILYSNWKYNLGMVKDKWSDYISDFKYLELWFEGVTDLTDWLSVIEKLILNKKAIENNTLYCYHPLTAISEESILFFKGFITELNELQRQIKQVVGGIEVHLAVLKKAVMQADKLLDNNPYDLEFEQIIIKRLMTAASKISNSSLIGKIDAIYFADNIRAMLKDYDEQTEEEGNSPFKLSVVNLENMKRFKVSYFAMCEADKYPRPFIENFPYTTEINEILSKEKYGIACLPSGNFDILYHLKLERYLLKNVLDFTTEELIITHAEKEFGMNKKISVFAQDIATAFGCDVIFEPNTDNKEKNRNNDMAEMQAFNFKQKETYTLTDLAIFKLCPKLYYHNEQNGKSPFLTRLQLKFYAEAVVYCDLFKRFMDYNLENKMVYNKYEYDYKSIVEKIHSQVVSESRELFSFLSNYEVEDLARNTINKMLSSIENSKKYLKGDTYTVIIYKDVSYEGDGYSVIAEHDNRFVDYDIKKWRMSQNSTYLEFLVLKTSDGKSELIHYADMIKALDDNNPNEDRVNLISRIIAKINIQFDSKRFALDGIKRTNELVNQICQYDFSKAQAMNSNYCTYCRINDVCMRK